MCLISLSLSSCSFKHDTSPSNNWPAETLKNLTLRQKIGQMMVYYMNTNILNEDSHVYNELVELIQSDGVGAIHIWKGEAGATLPLTNGLQSLSKIPILFQADLEYGLFDRFQTGTEVPPAMAIAATQDPKVAYAAGKITAQEGRAIGIHLALAPVVDVNNNPDNPIINTRSFGETPEQVIKYAIPFMQGLQHGGMAATAKHFPGHGDTGKDSHSSLAMIPDDSLRLWTIELEPFRKLVEGGVNAVMIGHINAGSVQRERHAPATLSRFWIQDILEKELGFKGVVVTDAMAMGGIVNRYSSDYALVETIIAGSDLILQNYDVKHSIDVVENAVLSGKIPLSRINEAVLKLLELKYHLGLADKSHVTYSEFAENFNRHKFRQSMNQAAARAVTLVKDKNNLIPIVETDSIITIINLFDTEYPKHKAIVQEEMKRIYSIHNITLMPSSSSNLYANTLNAINENGVVIVNAFVQPKARKDRIFLPENQTQFLHDLMKKTDNIVLISFGTPYLIRDFQDISTYLCVYTSSQQMQIALANAISGQTEIGGRLPVTIPGVAEINTGFHIMRTREMIQVAQNKWIRPTPVMEQPIVLTPEHRGNYKVIMDNINDALDDKAWPGGVLLATHHGEIFVYENFGYHTYDHTVYTSKSDFFDLASVTKVLATTSAVMSLYDEGKIHIDDKIIDYIPQFTSSDSVENAYKASITLKQLLTHSAGLPPFKRFYNMAAPTQEARWDSLFQVALDTVPGGKYQYSDIGLMLLGKMIENISGQGLDAYVIEHIFDPLGMSDTHYLPKDKLIDVMPTEINEYHHGLTHGVVHDENSASFGGVTGHAGLFSTAYDLGIFSIMMLNNGRYHDIQIFDSSTVALFTSRQFFPDSTSSRCLGWDSPSDIASGGPYLSSASFGHTGFTGTSIWIDPVIDISVILLTNAVHPNRNNKIPGYYDWRQKIHASVYESLGFEHLNPALEWRDRWNPEIRKSWWKRLFSKK